MLGNFSFGDYFKTDAIAFAWKLLTEVWKLPPDRLHATIFRAWDKARTSRATTRPTSIWRHYLPADQISELGAATTSGPMGETGPCGRCSEIHYFRGNHLPCSEPVCLGVACSCDRYVEIWNNVFMEFDRQADGTLNPAAGAVDRHRHGPRADHGRPAGRALELRHRPVHAAADGDRRPGRHATYGGTHGRRPTSRCASSPTTRARSTFLHRRRRRALQRVARLRAAQDHAARDAPRQAARHRRSRSSTGSSTCSLREMGEAYPELPAQRDYVERMIRSEEERFDVGARRPACPASRRRSTARQPATGVLPATRPSGCTTPSACRATSSRTWRSSAA